MQQHSIYLDVDVFGSQALAHYYHQRCCWLDGGDGGEMGVVTAKSNGRRRGTVVRAK